MRAQKLNCTSVPPLDYRSITPSLSHSIPKRKIADYSILLSEVLSECVYGRTVKKSN
ncbi:unnamed protein product [Ectocarpus sp. CCAP 1310/34]|nr:unnamed protein product [Ectocarpus sp. CCAP 1310/34]